MAAAAAAAAAASQAGGGGPGQRFAYPPGTFPGHGGLPDGMVMPLGGGGGGVPLKSIQAAIDTNANTANMRSSSLNLEVSVNNKYLFSQHGRWESIDIYYEEQNGNVQ